MNLEAVGGIGTGVCVVAVAVIFLLEWQHNRHRCFRYGCTKMLVTHETVCGTSEVLTETCTCGQVRRTYKGKNS